MTVYSLTETTGNAGCYGVFSSEEKATAAAMEFIKSWQYDNAEETIFDGFHKCIYYGEPDAYGNCGCFEIWKHELDAT
jgi:hypothetical protein